ncbi:MAG: hypothetical protein LC777_16385, partial [Actinobacteria bacterium]|nr:hypothetical protein [Actinomycetota bacterium]
MRDVERLRRATRPARRARRAARSRAVHPRRSKRRREGPAVRRRARRRRRRPDRLDTEDGVGVNIQLRAIALHHIDCPWRPADTEQRDGRVMRQGNQHAEVGNYRYVVEGSFDAYSWQTVERKAGFIAQVMRGRLDVREIDDIGDSALSFAEVKALASGDPLILDKAAVDAERTRLAPAARAPAQPARAQPHDRRRRSSLQQVTRDLPAIQAAIAAARDTRGDAFAMLIGDRRTTARPEAARHIQEWIAANSRGGIPYGRPELALGQLGELGGLPIDARLVTQLGGRAPSVELAIRDVPAQPATLGQDRVRIDAQSLVRQLEHRVADLPALAERTQAAGLHAADEANRAQHARDQPFKHELALRAATLRSAEITAQMQQRQQTPDTDAAATPADGAAAGPSP